MVASSIAPDAAAHERRSHVLALAAVCVVSVVYLASLAAVDWIPHDEGTYAQSAARVLDGEIPHRDFDDPYTGLGAFTHAAAFRVFGENLRSLRWLMLALSLPWIAAVYAIAARVAKPPAAALVSLACVAWSLPNYFSASVNWFNLIFATFGALALLRFVERPRWHWAFLAGLCGGMSCLFKSAGLFCVAGGLLGLVYHDQLRCGMRRTPSAPSPAGSLVVAGVTLFALLLFGLVTGRPTVTDYLHFFVPAALLAAALVWRELHTERESLAGRWRNWAGSFAPFAAGVLLPIAVYMLGYGFVGALPALYRGVIELPRQRVAGAALDLPPLASVVAVVPLALALSIQRLRGSRALAVLTAIGLGLLLLFGGRQVAYQAVWYSARPVIPLLAGLVAWHVVRRDDDSESGVQLFVLASLAATVSLVQFPLSAGVYFCYVAPLAILGLLFVERVRRTAGGPLLTILLVFYTAFPVVWFHRQSTYLLGFTPAPLGALERLDMERGGLRVPTADARRYRALVELIEEHSADGDYIYATPDSPEVYFLCDRRNPTRTFFDFFEPDFAEPAARAERLASLLEARQVNVIVLRHWTEFSSFEPVRALLERVGADYPNRVELDEFTVLWRE